MTVTTASTTISPTPLTPTTPELRATARRAFRFERMKLTGLRSTWAVSLSVFVTVVGTAVATASVLPANEVVTPSLAFSALLGGPTLAMLIVAAFGAVVGARDHVTGAIRTTFTLVPHRGRVVAAKAGALFAVLLPTLLVSYATAAVAGTAVLHHRGIESLPLDSHAVLGVLWGSVAYLCAVGLIGLALGLVLRSTGGAVAAALGGIVALPSLVGLFSDAAARWLPSSAGAALSALDPAAAGMGRGTAALVLVAWVLGALAAAAAVLSHRDA